MPSGYTSDIYDGKDTSFVSFAKRCSRAFGARVGEKENGLDSEYKPRLVDEYYLERLAESVKNYNESLTRTPEQWRKLYDDEMAKMDELDTDIARRREELAGRYLPVLEKAKAWNPPTEDHVKFKEFMIDQLEDSIRFDGADAEPTLMERPSFEVWVHLSKRQSERLVSIYAKSVFDDVENTIKSNNWVNVLFDSLAED